MACFRRGSESAWGGRCACGALAGLLLGLFVFVSAPAAGQTSSTQAAAGRADDAPTPQSHPNDPSLWNVERMMEDAVLQLTRRYNLTAEQEQYTRLLLKKRVREFLKNHESDIRELLKESIDFKLRLKKDSPAALKRWADRALPIYNAAMTAIEEGNKEWGEILNDQQKLIHQQDLDQMKLGFSQARVTLSRWTIGDALAGEISDPKAQMQGWRMDREGRSSGVVSSDPQQAVLELKIEEQWQQYVDRFIVAYALDEKQTAAARGIHKDMLNQARNYRAAHKEFEEIEGRLKTFRYDPKRPDAEARLRQRRLELEAPIRRMFVTLAQRLDDLLSNEQRVKITPDQKAGLETIARSLSGESHDAAVRAASQPAPPGKPQPASRPAPAQAESAEKSASTETPRPGADTEAPPDKPPPADEPENPPERE